MICQLADPDFFRGPKNRAREGKMPLDLRKLFYDCFDPQPGEKVLFMTDMPHGDIADTEAWQQRRNKMVPKWYTTMLQISGKQRFDVFPIHEYLATGANSAPLSRTTEAMIRGSTLVVAMTQFSATGPLGQIIKSERYLRAASLPGVIPIMEETGLAVDYAEVQRRCDVLESIIKENPFSFIEFSTGHKLRVDVRWRKGHKDNGHFPFARLGTFGNLPAGEVCPAPYEGERLGEPSLTEGDWPVAFNGKIAVFKVKENRIGEITGESEAVAHFEERFGKDPARRNLAEIGYGLIPMDPIPCGAILQDEKLGLHLAWGMSSHLGGIWGPEKFKGPETIEHEDRIYAKGFPVEATRVLVSRDSDCHNPIVIINNCQYVIF